MSEQVPFQIGTNSFAENPEQRTPCVLLLDVSGSMNGQPVAELNAGVQTYKDSLLSDALAAKRVEVAIVTFGGDVQTVCDFTTVESFQPPTLTGSGSTPMGAAILRAIEMVRRRKDLYKTHGVPYTRPWIFLITDGEPDPDDVWQAAAVQVQQGQQAKQFVFYAVGVGGANFDVLRRINPMGEPLKLQGLEFRRLFQWLSSSQAAASRSTPGDSVPLADPTGPKGWAVMPG
jgi:uncharacterized protein YegL